ncbi:MAG: conjugal transfer protein TraX [Eubacteriaceae bacterium]|jgi:hypothetical protein|nr:conjugal transfer protein TraX [Eubacteriaceae bacterium]
MAINHTSIVLGWLLPRSFVKFGYFIGGLTFPIMAYMASEGFKKTRSKEKYILNLLVFSLISVFPYWMCFKRLNLNVGFSILLGVIALYICDRLDGIAAKAICVGALALLSNGCDWGFKGVVLIYAMGVIKNDTLRAALPIAAMFLYTEGSALADYYSSGILNSYTVPYMFGCLLAVPLLLMYNASGQKRGSMPKHLFYAFYPGHLIALYIAYQIALSSALS